QFGEVNVAMPSRYLQEIPVELIDWKQSPGMADSRGGTQPRALNARREGGAGDRLGSSPRASGGYGGGSYDRATAAAKTKPKTEWSNRVTGTVRDNGDLEL
ncbi:ATP-dependent DNA helicase PcrA, partial [Frigoribacterium sp. CFBP 8754]|nr:ATP-dependent DNA helicase PcrA [Frigoribacterium sp. CFBP 8754]